MSSCGRASDHNVDTVQIAAHGRTATHIMARKVQVSLVRMSECWDGQTMEQKGGWGV